ncbi:pyridoxal phosphate-dependent decarboxylase family protein [Pyruvatibacter mobilis]|uniref:pyridoxal phosphate-dependent decarboxylase family protein n=1 Tax=Pyruvatibacter mobilis TaxID=1712261 RepID=UPI003D123485
MTDTTSSRVSMPSHGTDWETLSAQMNEMATGDVKWREGKTAVYVFNAGEDVSRVQKEAYTRFMSENGLGPMAFPSLKRMEEEIIQMALSLLNAPDGADGSVTSGGTDSITMAIKTAREYARAKGRLKPGCQGNIVLPWSAHPAFDKAAEMMDLELRRIPVTDDFLANPKAMGEAVDDNTIMMVGSAPCFPYGLIDPIAEIGEVAAARDVWVHVDACVGGFFAPFARMNGADLPAFDFSVAQVHSMSADLHKYGYCAKGASTVLFRSAELKEHMIFDTNDWPGGRMITPTLAGTRPGGAIAAAWAVMNYLGVDGYRDKQGLVVKTREKIEAGVTALGFEVIGKPQLGLIGYRHPDLDSFAIWGKLFERGWFTSIVSKPQGIHLMLSPKHAEVADTYLADVEWAMEQVRGANSPAEQQEIRYGG